MSILSSLSTQAGDIVPAPCIQFGNYSFWGSKYLNLDQGLEEGAALTAAIFSLDRDPPGHFGKKESEESQSEGKMKTPLGGSRGTQGGKGGVIAL